MEPTTNDTFTAELSERLQGNPLIAMADRVRQIATEGDLVTQTQRYGRDYPEHLKRHVDDAAAVVMMRTVYIDDRLHDLVQSADWLTTMVCTENLDKHIPVVAIAAWDYGTALMDELQLPVRRIGAALALWALEQAPGLCQGLAAELRCQLMNYDPALQVLKYTLE
jgi:hypothetical protein